MPDRPFQRPGSTPYRRQEPWPYESPGVATPSVPILTPHPAPSIGQQLRDDHPSIPSSRARANGVVSMGAAGLLIGAAIGVVVADPPQPSPIHIVMESFPRALMGQDRVDAEVRDSRSPLVDERLNAELDDQVSSYRFAYGGDGATFDYGSLYTLTIVNGFLAVSVPVKGDPPSGDIPRVVSLRSSGISCVSEHPDIDFTPRAPATPQQMVPQPSTDNVPAAAPEAGGWSVRTDCVLVDREHNLALRLLGDGPANDILGTADQFRDELERIHADLIA